MSQWFNEQNYGNFTKNCSKTNWDAAQAPHNYHYLMKYNPCIVWVHLLKFLGHWCDLNLPKSFTTHVCVTLFSSRESSSMCLIQNNKDYTPNCTTGTSSKQRCALCCLCEIGHIRVHEGFDISYWTLLFWFCIKHFADPFLHEDKLKNSLTSSTCLTMMRKLCKVRILTCQGLILRYI